METAMDRRMARVAPALAMRGDIAGVPDPLTGLRLMVVEGAMLVGPGAAGLERQPRCAMTIAWDVTTVHRGRSEEHTSELQSLMRISYAVFCLKKKNKYHKCDHILH